MLWTKVTWRLFTSVDSTCWTGYPRAVPRIPSTGAFYGTVDCISSPDGFLLPNVRWIRKQVLFYARRLISVDRQGVGRRAGHPRKGYEVHGRRTLSPELGGGGGLKGTTKLRNCPELHAVAVNPDGKTDLMWAVQVPTLQNSGPRRRGPRPGRTRTEDPRRMVKGAADLLPPRRPF